MNRFKAGGKAIRLPEMRSKASALGAIEEQVGGGTSTPHPSGEARVEVGPSLEPRKGSTKEKVAARKRQRVEEVQPLRIKAPTEFVPRPPPMQIDPSLREVEVVAPRGGRAPLPTPSKARDEVATNGGSGLVRQALENKELGYQKEAAEKNFSELTSKLEKVREELATSKRVAELEEQKRKKCEEALTRRDNELAKVKKAAKLAIHNLVEQHVSDFIKSPIFAEVVHLYHLPTLI
ncbi:hypothetical protein SLEP1_g36266 [Rubroshorea leprosula]|uniref:Uncharacterized protein n=1 Tax=Rubroshorea leprosula TaxID=152421 RepID=A0AAV5KR97_9ROSI|nr:hypothetical protein SLEP1_g36266 [Rubroshorea leprosula]